MRLVTGNFENLAVSTDAMREMDRRTIEEYGVPGAVLMESAGSCVREVACLMAPSRGRVVVMAGAGNNAGDGFVAARQLANRGFSVCVVTAVEGGGYKGDAKLNFSIIERMGIEITQWGHNARALLRGAEVIIDALLGTGLSGPLRPPYAEMVEAINAAGAHVLSVDIPSGLNGDTGEVATVAVRADRTVTFALPKTGLYRGEGPAVTGEIILGDIEMPRAVYPAGKVPD